MIILRFAIVIFLIATVLFEITAVSAPTFMPLALTMGVCTLVYVIALVSLLRDDLEPISKKQFWIAFGVGLGVVALLVLIKVLLIFV